MFNFYSVSCSVPPTRRLDCRNVFFSFVFYSLSWKKTNWKKNFLTIKAREHQQWRMRVLIFFRWPKISLAIVYNIVSVLFTETSCRRTCRIRPLVRWPSRMSPTFWYTRSAASLYSRCLATTIQEPSGARRSRIPIWEITGDSGCRRTPYRHLIKVSENCFFFFFTRRYSTYHIYTGVYVMCVCFFFTFSTTS